MLKFKAYEVNDGSSDRYFDVYRGDTNEGEDPEFVCTLEHDEFYMLFLSTARRDRLDVLIYRYDAYIDNYDLHIKHVNHGDCDDLFLNLENLSTTCVPCKIRNKTNDNYYERLSL